MITEAQDLEIRAMLARLEMELPEPVQREQPVVPPPFVDEEEEGGLWELLAGVIVAFLGFLVVGVFAGMWISRMGR